MGNETVAIAKTANKATVSGEPSYKKLTLTWSYFQYYLWLAESLKAENLLR